MSAKLPRDILSGWNVLVVDDDEHSQDVASLLLQFHGATVHLAENGAVGLEKAQSIRPKFILSDISMPVMDGWEMVAALKSDTRTKDIPVIALTAHAMVGDRERAMMAGCHNYLSKPLTPATFVRDLLMLLDDIPELRVLPEDAQ